MTSDGQQPPPLPEPEAGPPAYGSAEQALPPAGGAPDAPVPGHARQPWPAQQPAQPSPQQYPVQPYGGYAAPPGPPPDNYLVWAILSTVMCCLPLGVVSIVYAAQVNDKWVRGDVAGAMESSRKARQFATWSAVVMVAVWAILAIVYVGFFAVAIGAGVATSP